MNNKKKIIGGLWQIFKKMVTLNLFQGLIQGKIDAENKFSMTFIYEICQRPVIVFILLSIPLFAQKWVDISPTFSQSYNYLITGTFIDRNVGWMIDWGQTKLFHTGDSGLTWEIRFDGIDTYFYDILFIDKNNGWAKIYNGIPFGNPNIPSLWSTKDGGKTWQKVSTPSAFSSFTFIDTLNGFSGGESKFCRTTDGGKTWQRSSIIDSSARFGVTDIYFSDSAHGWAVGGNARVYDAGIILKSMDGGATWLVNVPEASAIGMGVFFTDSLHGVVVGSNPPFFDGTIMRTEDGGENWENQYLPCSWLNDVVFTDDSTGWTVGDYGFIWKTIDKGKTWNRIESGTRNDLIRIVFVENGRVGFIFGDKNTLLRYEATPDNVDEKKWDDFPMNFKLHPNYPNPFNGETKIEYELPQGGHVCLRILDLTGKEVVTLEDGWQPMGRYFVKWNCRDKFGKEVASGVYLCYLKSGVFSRTKKICLNR